jgi:EAL domain-containing protein (putative c-di-GMP-specific phosphodiesterase class I)/GGDEF domain-containing protein
MRDRGRVSAPDITKAKMATKAPRPTSDASSSRDPLDSAHVLAAVARLSERLENQPGAHADLARISSGYAQALAALGDHDHITLLPNRRRFKADMDLASPGPGASLVLITLADARYFNEVLRALGHAFADAFVRKGARRLMGMLGEGTPLYHVSVLSFAFVLPAGEDAEALAAAIVAQSREPTLIKGVPITSRVGIGIVTVPREPQPWAVLLRSALAAAQDSRSRIAGWARYDKASDLAHQRAFFLVRDLGAALLSDDQLSIQFQPRVDLSTGECRSAEVLLRWRHPSFGPVSPGEFIPLAEATSLIGPVTDWVLDASLRQAAAWEASQPNLRLSMNVSALDLRSGVLADRLETLLQRHRVDASRIELEVTEGAITTDDEATRSCLSAIIGLGVELAVDDFGTGYSNMGNLATLPAQVLKIDRSFVQPLEEPGKHRQLVRSIINLAHDLDFKVVAEGIETDSVYRLLTEWGCDEGQGYLMSRPLQAADFAAWRTARSTSFMG